MRIAKNIFKVLVIILLLWFVYAACFSSDDIEITTEYGDSFVAEYDDWDGDYGLREKNGKLRYLTTLTLSFDKKDFHSVYDKETIRCYRISYRDESTIIDEYIFMLKEYDKYVSVREGAARYQKKYISEEEAECVRSLFLSDELLMEICLFDFDYYYHDDLVQIRDKLTVHDYEGLDKYGLTEDMIEDDEAMERKLRILLKNPIGV